MYVGFMYYGQGNWKSLSGLFEARKESRKMQSVWINALISITALSLTHGSATLAGFGWMMQVEEQIWKKNACIDLLYIHIWCSAHSYEQLSKIDLKFHPANCEIKKGITFGKTVSGDAIFNRTGCSVFHILLSA